MFCKKCGKEVEDKTEKCPFCGEELKEKQEAPVINIVNTNTNTNTNVMPGYVPKKKSVALVLAIFLGYFGIHRFYVGKAGTGILWLLTLGLFGIGWIIDIILILTGSFRDAAHMPLV